MRNRFLPSLMLFAVLSGCAPAAARTTPAAGWSLYSNAAYGYEIRYPEGFDLWPTGPEGERDGAGIRIAVQNRQAPVPVLDIRIDPRTPESGFPGAFARPQNMESEFETASIGGKPAKQLTLRWKSSGEIAFVEIFFEGVVFQFSAEAGLRDVHASPWWKIVSTFRLTR